MSKTLIVLNPHAGSGRAGRLWKELEPILWDKLGELVVAVTQNPDEVAPHLERAYASGLTRVISIGGDGTNHALVNELVRLNDRHPEGPPMVYGTLPIGTGGDWARGLGIPLNDVRTAAKWIAEAQPRPTDIGVLDYDGKQEYFLNIASAGIGGEVSLRVNQTPVRRPWTFLQSTITTLLQHHPQQMQIKLDGQPWYDGTAYIVAIANGRMFGHGMNIAPQAEVRDGLFDVVLVEGVSRLTVLMALQQVYKGVHLSHPAVRFQKASQVEVHSPAGPISLELDGEYARGQELTFRLRPGLMPILS
jgi:YegS/Rv2252/BmrU family lipid kinase